MKENINIDDLLKQELGSLNQLPPANAWQNIASKIPATQAAVQTAAAAKTVVGLSLKYVAVVLATIAVGAAAYVYITSSPASQSALPNKQTPNNLQPIQTRSNQTEEVVKSTAENKISIPKKLQSIEVGSGHGSASCPGLPNKNDVAIDHPAPTSSSNTTELPKPVIQPNNNNVTNAVSTDDFEKNQTEVKKQPSGSPSVSPSSEEFLKPNIPNVFTPNGDGYNDEFVITIEDEQLFELKILDAKGQIVFESKDKNLHWAGIKQNSGIACEPGLYVFALRYQTQSMKTPKVEQGVILLKQ